MTPSDWIALGALVLAALGSAATVYGVLNARISKSAARLHEKLEEVKRDYVRRDDLRDDIHNLKDDVARLERGQENVAAKVDQMIANLVPALARLAEAALNFKQK